MTIDQCLIPIKIRSCKSSDTRQTTRVSVSFSLNVASIKDCYLTVDFSPRASINRLANRLKQKLVALQASPSIDLSPNGYVHPSRPVPQLQSLIL
jgi:hypothetical protein